MLGHLILGIVIVVRTNNRSSLNCRFRTKFTIIAKTPHLAIRKARKHSRQEQSTHQMTNRRLRKLVLGLKFRIQKNVQWNKAQFMYFAHSVATKSQHRLSRSLLENRCIARSVCVEELMEVRDMQRTRHSSKVPVDCLMTSVKCLNNAILRSTYAVLEQAALENSVFGILFITSTSTTCRMNLYFHTKTSNLNVSSDATKLREKNRSKLVNEALFEFEEVLIQQQILPSYL